MLLYFLSSIFECRARRFNFLVILQLSKKRWDRQSCSVLCAVFFVTSNRRVINRSRFYREIESNSSCFRLVYIHVWILKFERFDRIVCACRWEYLSAIYSHFAQDNWFAKTFFLNEIHTVFIKTFCSVRSVIMTRSDFIVESFMNNFLMSLITAWLS
jgi:hypothetical protein